MPLLETIVTQKSSRARQQQTLVMMTPSLDFFPADPLLIQKDDEKHGIEKKKQRPKIMSFHQSLSIFHLNAILLLFHSWFSFSLLISKKIPHFEFLVLLQRKFRQNNEEKEEANMQTHEKRSSFFMCKKKNNDDDNNNDDDITIIITTINEKQRWSRRRWWWCQWRSHDIAFSLRLKKH